MATTTYMWSNRIWPKKVVMLLLGIASSHACVLAAMNSRPLLTLSAANTSFEIPFNTQEAQVARARFIRIELVNLNNPAQLALVFHVDLLTPQGQRIELGTFSPFPADRPGIFIVATAGKVRSSGTLKVWMETPDGAGDISALIASPEWVQ